jgi:hypothetical protein
MLGNGGQAHVERFGKFADRDFPQRQPGQDGAAGGIGEGAEDVVEIHSTIQLINSLV